jgi:predicted kinase
VDIPADALVVLIGASGSGKSTFATRAFPPAAVLSSDALRASKHATGWSKTRHDVFDELLTAVERRLADGTLTVVDATNTDWRRRSELIRSARAHHRPAVAIVFALPADQCLAGRTPEKRLPAATIRRQAGLVLADLERLDLEGFAPVVVFRSHEEARATGVEIKRGPDTRASLP